MPLDATGYVGDIDLVHVQILKAARNRIKYRFRWTRGQLKSRVFRMECARQAITSAAKKLGALDDSEQDACNALLNIAYDYGFKSIESMNDNMHHFEVLKAFDKAIAAS